MRSAAEAVLVAALAVTLVVVVSIAQESEAGTCAEWRGTVGTLPADIPEPVHWYPLTQDSVVGGAVCDAIGTADGTVDGDVVFTRTGAEFDGDSSIELPAGPEFSAAGTGTGGLTVAAVVEVYDWDGGEPMNDYIHWMGKGEPGAQEWTFRQYQEDSERSRRVSFYAFSPGGGLGAGSYFEGRNGEMRVAGVIDTYGNSTTMYLDGIEQDTDRLDEYDVVPEDTGVPVVIGSRGDHTGHLIGKMRNVIFFDRALSGEDMERFHRALVMES